MKTLFASLLLAFVCVLPVAHATGANDINGFWVVDSKDAVIHIYERDGSYYGAITWLKAPVYTASDGPRLQGKPVVDILNPDPSLRGRSLLGLELLSGLTYDGEGKWEDGKIYNSEDGKLYSCNVSLASPDQLKLHGFIGIPLLGKTTVWTRSPSAVPQAIANLTAKIN